MNTTDRKSSYTAYIDILNNYGYTKEAAEALSSAFDITDEDIDKNIEDVDREASKDESTGSASAKFALMVEDVRDLRDYRNICMSRLDILKGTCVKDISDREHVFII